ncbi:putative shikimate dehydrogenase [Peptoanaerobacter stomatis]|uniref:Shikimate kinase n=1 Tax=Peptoanaerobacter stomatis TaxID=796937 RepID=J5U3U1_9FIRM|nr:shikimate kinase [Peptoanaerobacter stomatis]EJU19574.1 putative shikimate dehydrogenase [Peptoanaerobacter stomatis]
MIEYGLLGKSLTHSFSKSIHSQIDDYDYTFIEKQEQDAKEFIKSREFKGINVTMPYKKTVLEFCDELSNTAKKIGCINTLINKNGKLCGYNTDYYGIIRMIEKSQIDIKDKKVLILGSGATSDTAREAAEYLGASKITFVSRKGNIKFDDYDKFYDSEIIINCTPVGMYPNNLKILVDIEKFNNLQGVCDVIYNPVKTRLLIEAEKKGIKTSNGLIMLVAQAVKAAELFTGKKYDANIEDKIIENLKKNISNIVIIGMPGSGKTTIGKEISKISGKKSVDIDEIIERETGKDISQIFRDYGEEYFRQKEKEVISRIGKENNQIISTGGGSILDYENYLSLKQNSRIYYIKRPLDKLAVDGRPLSSGGINVLEKLYEQRHSLYENFADFEIDNDNIERTSADIWREFNENFGA